MPPPTTTTRGDAVAGSDGGHRSQVRKDLVTGATRGEPTGRWAASQSRVHRSARPGADRHERGCMMTRSTHRTALAALAATALLARSPPAAARRRTRWRASDTAAGAAGSGPAAARPGRRSSRGRPGRRCGAKAVIKTGEISVTSRHLARVRAEVDRPAGGASAASVDREQTTNARDGSIERSRLVLRVPVDEVRRDQAGAREARQAHVLDGVAEGRHHRGHRHRRAGADAAEQPGPAAALPARARKDVTDLIRYEDQITARQSELQSLKAQQAYLDRPDVDVDDHADLSTPETYVAPPGALEDAGFLAGLQGGLARAGRASWSWR